MDVVTGVRDLLDKKGRQVHTVTASTHLVDCAAKMNDADVGSLLVLTDDGVLCGIITYHDLLRGIVEHKDLDQVPVSAFMKTDVHSLPETATLKEAESIMVSKGIRHLPIVNGNQIVGIVTRIDVLKLHMSHADHLSDELVKYIGGVYR
jgi:signal-transduction protein with cAMP-binding, CBS, and nucleotidyltransferase domain